MQVDNYVGFVISIHALRVEGDAAALRPCAPMRISIHALRVEGDAGESADGGAGRDFNPRPPCGGRRKRSRM